MDKQINELEYIEHQIMELTARKEELENACKEN